MLTDFLIDVTVTSFKGYTCFFTTKPRRLRGIFFEKFAEANFSKLFAVSIFKNVKVCDFAAGKFTKT